MKKMYIDVDETSRWKRSRLSTMKRKKLCWKRAKRAERRRRRRRRFCPFQCDAAIYHGFISYFYQ